MQDSSGKGNEGKESLTPDIPLGKEALDCLKSIFGYTKILTIALGDVKGEKEILELLRTNSEVQYSAIFCLKAIGACLEEAINTFDEKDPLIPLFWKNLIYLRNALVHNSLDLLLPLECLPTLAKILRDTGHIFKYFSKVCDKRNTNVDFEGQRYKVFLEIYELSHFLQNKFSREVRDLKPQEEYLTLLRKLIFILAQTTGGVELTEQGLRELKKVNPRKYYAIQNCLEFIATLANPNPEFAVLTEKSRQKIIGIHQDADMWFRSLGESRMNAMHQNRGVIEDKELSENIENIRRIASILKPKAEPGNAPVLPPAANNSPSKMVKSLGPVVQNPAKGPLQKISPTKSGTIKQPVGSVPPKISKGSSNIASAPKKGPSKK